MSEEVRNRKPVEGHNHIHRLEEDKEQNEMVGLGRREEEDKVRDHGSHNHHNNNHRSYRNNPDARLEDGHNHDHDCLEVDDDDHSHDLDYWEEALVDCWGVEKN